MRTIRENAEKILTDGMSYANGQIQVKFTGKSEGEYKLLTIRSYTESAAKNNPNFFRWLFNDYEITYFGTNLTESQKQEYQNWLHDL